MILKWTVFQQQFQQKNAIDPTQGMVGKSVMKAPVFGIRLGLLPGFQN